MSTDHGKSLNAADLAAAKRFIAQFNGEADGRHNSTMHPSRQTELETISREQYDSVPRGMWGMPQAFWDYLGQLYLERKRSEMFGRALQKCVRKFNRTAYELDIHSVVQTGMDVASRVRLDSSDCQIGDYCQMTMSIPDPLCPSLVTVNGKEKFVPTFLWNQKQGVVAFWKRIE